MALTLWKHVCKVDCDVKSGIDPIPFWLHRGQKMLGFSQVLKPRKYNNMVKWERVENCAFLVAIIHLCRLEKGGHFWWPKFAIWQPKIFLKSTVTWNNPQGQYNIFVKICNKLKTNWSVTPKKAEHCSVLPLTMNYITTNINFSIIKQPPKIIPAYLSSL